MERGRKKELQGCRYKGRSCCYAERCVSKRIAWEMWRKVVLLCGVYGKCAVAMQCGQCPAPDLELSGHK